jgi:hypothetical protein
VLIPNPIDAKGETKMNKQLINSYDTSGINRHDPLVKIAGQGNAQFLLRHLVLISRIFFAVFVIGFMGYFFDQMKQSFSNIWNKTNTNNFNQ